MKMNLIKVFFGVLFSLFIIDAKGQNINIDTASEIAAIKKQINLINNRIPVYRKIVKDDMGQSAEGGQVTAYYDGKNLKEITANYYGETGRVTQQYYFSHSKLIYCYGISYNYKMPMNIVKHVKIKSSEVSQFYFYNNLLLKYQIIPTQALTAAQLKAAVKDTMTEAERLCKLVAD
jgi:hypothetical protein